METTILKHKRVLAIFLLVLSIFFLAGSRDSHAGSKVSTYGGDIQGILTASGMSEDLAYFNVTAEGQRKLVGLFSSYNFYGTGNKITWLNASITFGGTTFRNLICANPLYGTQSGNVYTRYYQIYAEELDNTNAATFVGEYNKLRYPKSGNPTYYTHNKDYQMKMSAEIILLSSIGQTDKTTFNNIAEAYNREFPSQQINASQVMADLQTIKGRTFYSWIYSADADIVSTSGGYSQYYFGVLGGETHVKNTLNFANWMKNQLYEGKLTVRKANVMAFWATVPGYDSTYPYNTKFQTLHWLSGELVFGGKVNLQKVSAAPQCTNGNINYNLAGAEYNVYGPSGVLVGKLTTDASGNSNTIERLAPGTYTAKEVKASKGYLLNPKPITVNVTAGQTSTFKASEPIKGDPLRVMLYKQGNKKEKLANAIYEVRYYQETVSSPSELVGKTPKKVWTMKTGKTGQLRLDDYNANSGGKIGGDDFYKDQNGDNIGLVGSYVVKETKAPLGYELDPNEYVSVMKDDGSLTKLEGFTGVVYNAPTQINKYQWARFNIQKYDVQLGNKAQTEASLAGAKYDVKFVKAWNPVDKDMEGQILETLTTDANGQAKTTVDLPLGEYDLIETTPSKGYDLNPVAVRIKADPDDSGNKYTSLVGQVSENDGVLISMFNKHIDELNTVNKMNANGVNDYRVIPHIEKIPNPKKVEDNALVKTAESPEMGRISLTKHQDGESGIDESTMSGIRIPEEGIEFTIYDINGTEVDKIHTDKEGRGSSNWLPKGTYTVKQTSHHEGFVDVPDWKVVVKGDWSEHQYNLENYRKYCWLKIVKQDEETGKTIPQKDVSFELYKSNKDGTVGDKVIQHMYYPSTKEISLFKTDENGMVQLPERLMTGFYVLREIKAPTGYYLSEDGKDVLFEITKDDKDNNVMTVFIKKRKNTPQKGQLILEKTGKKLVGFEKDEKEKDLTNLIMKDGFVGGTVWELRAREDIISGDTVTKFFSKGDLVDTITTNDEGVVKSKEVPLGKYTLKEVKVPKQYVLDERTYDIDFTPQVQTVRVHSVTEQKYNERKDIEFGFDKIFEQSDWFTNYPQARFGLFLDEDYTENGVTVPKDTMLGITDVKTSAKDVTEETKTVPKMVDVEKVTKRYEVSEFEVKTVEDKDKPIVKEIETKTWIVNFSELGKNVQKIFNSQAEAESKMKEDGIEKYTIEEKTEKEKRVVGYESKTTKILINVFKFNDKAKSDAKVAEIEGIGHEASVKTFESKATVKEPSKTETEKKVIRTLKLKGTFKELPIDGKYYVKELSTDKKYVLDGDKHLTGFDFKDSEKQHNKQVVDKAIINNLKKINLIIAKTEEGSNKEIPVAGAVYRLVAVDTIKGETTVGEYITNEKGEIKIDLLPLGNYYLQEVVSPEGYVPDDQKHNIDVNDKEDGEDVKVETENERIPDVGTTATDNETGKKEALPETKITILDEVKVINAVVGKTYTVKGKLMDKETGEVVKNKDGQEVTAETTFVATMRNFSVYLKFVVDGDVVRGKEVVAFEDLYRGDRLLVTHNDLKDEDQTIKVKNPKIHTTLTATDGLEGKEVDAFGEYDFSDAVKHYDLVKGLKYRLKLVMMVKETGKVALDPDGNPYTMEKDFIAGNPEDVESVKLKLNTKNFRGMHLVAFEELYYVKEDGSIEKVAEHKDINDIDQTVYIRNPEIGTTATWNNGGKKVVEGGKIVLVDRVKYSELNPGEKYKAVAWVVLKANGKTITEKVEHWFVASETGEGYVDVPITVDTTKLGGSELVVFEEVYDKDGNLVAEHKDINDKGQTVYVEKKPTPQTGDSATGLGLFLGLAMACGAAVIVMRRKSSK